MKKFTFTLGILLWISLNSFVVKGADILAGYISATHVSGFEYEITVTTWTNINHQSFKRCAVDLNVFLDGTASVLQNVPRVNGPDMTYRPYCFLPNPKAGETVRGPIRKNIYKTNYTFAGAGEGKIVYQSLGREINIINAQRPDLTQFSVEVVFDIPATGSNSSPTLNTDLLVPAPSGTALTFSGFVSDTDGDTQSYTIQKPALVTAATYRYPDNADFGGGTYTVGMNDGILNWNTPSFPGLYLVSIKIEDIRGGNVIGYNTVDFILEVDIAAGLEDMVSSPVTIAPNPVSDNMEVRLELNQPSLVQANLFDLTGRMVQQLTNENAVKGAFERNWAIDPSVGTGIYFLRLQVNGAMETRKIMVKR